MQQDWFAVVDADGSQRRVGSREARRTTGPVSGACLVGALVAAGGGPAAATSQHVGDAVDLAWHALARRDEPVDLGAAPPTRRLRVQDLTRWNDAPGRSADDVRRLLARAADRAAAAV